MSEKEEEFENARMNRSTQADNLRERNEEVKEAVSGAEKPTDYWRGVIDQMKWQNRVQELGIKREEWPRFL